MDSFDLGTKFVAIGPVASVEKFQAEKIIDTYGQRATNTARLVISLELRTEASHYVNTPIHFNAIFHGSLNNE